MNYKGRMAKMRLVSNSIARLTKAVYPKYGAFSYYSAAM